MHQDNTLGYVCMRVCSFLSIACAIYLSHFVEKVSFLVKITLNRGGGEGNIYICIVLVTECSDYFYDCDRSCMSFSNKMGVLMMGNTVLTLCREAF